MESQTTLTSVLAPTVPGAQMPSARYVALWALGWAVVGCIVAGVIALATPNVDAAPALIESVLFAEIVGFSVLTSTRLIFPLFVRFPAWLRAALQLLTLFAGALFGSLAAVAVQPLFILARPQFAITIVLVNSLVAVIVGTALHTYDTMRRQIEASYRLIREKEALERELEIAREVQRELLPAAAPVIEGLELAGVCLPAVGVGGDYYDFLPFDERHVGLVIADVSGKGIPAALLMASLQAAVRSIALPSICPAEVTGRLDRMLFRSSSSSRYATMLLALYDANSRMLSYSNAGHHPPLVVRNGETMRLPERGLPLGMFGDSRYTPGEQALCPADLVVLYTDGVIETPGPNGEEFGERRLVDVLRAHRAESLESIVLAILEELRVWAGERSPHDDVTVVLARAR